MSVETEPAAPGQSVLHTAYRLRAGSSVATGIEDAFLTAYREGSFHYLLIVADYAGR